MAAKKKPTPAIDADAVRSELVSQLRAAGDPIKARSQQAYMKSTMAWWGVSNGASPP